MNKFILSCCSTADLTKEHFEQRDIHYICFHFELDGKHYPDDLGQSIPFPEFYQAMANGAETKTSQVNVTEFEEYFEAFLVQGMDILHVSLSSGISGTYNSANIARNNLLEKYPDRKIYIVDSLTASSGFGLLVDTLADLRDKDMDIDTVYQWALDNRLHLQTWFFSTDLTFYVKGGRISKTSGFVGNLLNICPLLNMDSEGHLIPRQKIRTKRKVMQAMVEQMEQFAENGFDYDGKCYMSHSACLEDAKAVAEMIETRFPKLKGKVEIYDVGTTIGSHTGPGTVALFFWGALRA